MLRRPALRFLLLRTDFRFVLALPAFQDLAAELAAADAASEGEPASDGGGVATAGGSGVAAGGAGEGGLVVQGRSEFGSVAVP